MTRLKDITFESNSLTGTDGADSSTGSIAIGSSSPIKGSYYADVPNVGSAYVQEDFTATGTLYVSVYLRVDAIPGSTTRFIEFRSGGSGTGPTVRLRTNGIALYDSGGSQVGSSYAVSAGDTVRVGLRYTVGSGSNGTCELFVATSDNAFGSAQASSTSDTGTTNPDRVRVGAPTSSVLDIAFDDLRIDDASMPGPSSGSGTVNGTAAGTASATGAAAGTVRLFGTASATASAAGVALATVLLFGAATGTASATGGAALSQAPPAAAGTASATGTATATVRTFGAAAGTASATGAATSSLADTTVNGTAAGAASATGGALATVRRFGAATGTAAATGAAAGTVQAGPSAAATATATGSATGTRTGLSLVFGAAAGTATATGAMTSSAASGSTLVSGMAFATASATGVAAGTSNTPGSPRAVYQDVTGLTAGSTYTVSIYVLVTSGRVTLRAYDGGTSNNPVSVVATAAADWQRISVTKVAPAGGSVRLWAEISAGAVAQLDAAQVELGSTIGLFRQSTKDADGGLYLYNVTRNLDGTGANDWIAGDAVFNTGQAGNGFIDLYSLAGVNGQLLDYIFNYDPGANGTPYEAGTFSANYNETIGFELFGDGAGTKIGGAVYFGMAAGTWQNLYVQLASVYNAVFGLVWEYWNGTSWATFTPTFTPSVGGVAFNSVGYNAVEWGAGGSWAARSINGHTAYWVRYRLTSFTSYTRGPITAKTRVYFRKRTYGPTIAMNVRNSSTYNDWTEHAALGNLNGLYDYGGETYGVAVGKYATGSSWLAADATNGIRIMNGATKLAQWDTAGNILIGQVAPSQNNVYISSGALKLRNNTTDMVTLGADGSILVGSGAASNSNVLITGGALKLRNGTTDKIRLNADGSSSFEGVINIGPIGGIFQGSGTFASPTTALKIAYDAGMGAWELWGSGVKQVYSNSSGKLIAGAGKTQLDASGISLLSPDLAASALPALGARLKFAREADGTTQIAQLYSYTNSDDGHNHLHVDALGGISYAGIIELSASGTTASSGLGGYVTIQGNGANFDTHQVVLGDKVKVQEGLVVGSGQSAQPGDGEVFIADHVTLGFDGRYQATHRLDIVGYGTTNTTAPIACYDSGGTPTFYVTDDGAGYLKAAAWTYGSDVRMKELVTPLFHGLDALLSLNPVAFDYINGPRNQYGFLAHEVAKVLPALVSEMPDGLLGLQTTNLIPIIVKAIQELYERTKQPFGD